MLIKLLIYAFSKVCGCIHSFQMKSIIILNDGAVCLELFSVFECLLGIIIVLVSTYPTAKVSDCA